MAVTLVTSRKLQRNEIVIFGRRGLSVVAAAFSPIFSHEFASQHHYSIRMASFLGVLACRFDKRARQVSYAATYGHTPQLTQKSPERTERSGLGKTKLH
jgi:hypothetical protein